MAAPERPRTAAAAKGGAAVPDPAAELHTAEAEMAEVDALLAQIEEELATGTGSPSPGKHHELLDLKRHTELRITGPRKRVKDAQEAARLAEIARLAKRIDKLAAAARDAAREAGGASQKAEVSGA